MLKILILPMQRTVSHSLHASNIKCKKLESEGKRPSVRLFALLGAQNAHIRKSGRKITFGSAQNATF